MESVEQGTFSNNMYVSHPDGDVGYNSGWTLVLRKDSTFTITNNVQESFTDSKQKTILLQNETTTYSGIFKVSKDGKSFDFRATSKVKKEEYEARPENNSESEVPNDYPGVSSSKVKFLADGQVEITVPQITGDSMLMRGAVPSWLKHGEEGHLTIA